jgi:hypothetical protein
LLNSNLNIHKIIKKAKKMGVKCIKTSIKAWKNFISMIDCAII